ncbi:Pentatricopeptide repeat-containing protein [Quillaja saponaria]|uniref:Pentatricopeptide repeat-containing protein n=1 Tax=Quillaja saponaria TaxID=32244 RepID=A0AAD7PV76_QUISA|nr:Pentatricopeptide repeat-containing protein [Quillaja saponaria]
MEIHYRSTPSYPLCQLITFKCKHSSVLALQNHSQTRALARKIIWQWKKEGCFNGKDNCVACASVIQALSRKRMPYLAEELLHEVLVKGFGPNKSTLSALMLYYAENSLFPQAQAIWEQMLNSSFLPSIQLISKIFDAYGKVGNFNGVTEILHLVNSRNFDVLPEVYSLAISCFGKGGQLELMEDTLRAMISRGFSVNSATGNAFVKYYSIFGSLEEMENAYYRLKRSRLLIEKDGIRAMSHAYIKEKKFYRLGEILRDVGLGRKNVGNLLWNLLLLSYAANFKMKSLQREFLRMVDSGFNPDLTTFNIRALAFSRMYLFWDIHLSLEHMKHVNVVPDLVTYGCVVDAYLDRRLGKNLDFALNRMTLDDCPEVLTDPLVFAALGKGDFHLSSEAFLEFKAQRKWSYRKLIGHYVKKHQRGNQIFWNY